jgi:DNA-binding response OmpR family regulator
MMDKITAPKILIVEDEPSLASALKEKFIAMGFSASVAKNGAEGLDHAIADHPDLILLDIIMPVMDGIEMVRKLRADEWGSTAKIIVLTALTANDLIDIKNSSIDLDYFLMKTDWTLDGIVQVAKKRLGIG